MRCQGRKQVGKALTSEKQRKKGSGPNEVWWKFHVDMDSKSACGGTGHNRWARESEMDGRQLSTVALGRPVDTRPHAWWVGLVLGHQALDFNGQLCVDWRLGSSVPSSKLGPVDGYGTSAKSTRANTGVADHEYRNIEH